MCLNWCPQIPSTSKMCAVLRHKSERVIEENNLIMWVRRYQTRATLWHLTVCDLWYPNAVLKTVAIAPSQISVLKGRKVSGILTLWSRRDHDLFRLWKNSSRSIDQQMLWYLQLPFRRPNNLSAYLRGDSIVQPHHFSRFSASNGKFQVGIFLPVSEQEWELGEESIIGISCGSNCLRAGVSI